MGNIIFCRGFLHQDGYIKELGGAGTIMSADSIKLDTAHPTISPAIVVSVEDGDQIDTYINTTM